MSVAPSPLRFDLLAHDGGARLGCLWFDRGTVETPVFMPVGTYGTVKGMTPAELARSGCGWTDSGTRDEHLAFSARFYLFADLHDPVDERVGARGNALLVDMLLARLASRPVAPRVARQVAHDSREPPSPRSLFRLIPLISSVRSMCCIRSMPVSAMAGFSPRARSGSTWSCSASPAWSGFAPR